MAVNQSANSPYKFPRHPTAEGLYANIQHKRSATIHAARMANYVDSLLDPLNGANSMALPGTHVLDAIIADTNVSKCHRALLRSLAMLEKALYGRTVQLLNSISVAYYEHFLGKGDAVIFGSRPNSYPAGDYLALEVKPDVCGFRGLFADLLVARGRPNFISLQPWSALIQVGELKRILNAAPVGGQLKTYLTGLKRYRADMTTVHGFSLERGCVQLSSLSPGGMIQTDPVPWGDLSPWIAHVVQVYQSLDERDVDMEYCIAQEQFHRWDIRKSGLGLAVMPFHVGFAPGRTTFACFEMGRFPANEPGTDPEYLTELSTKYNSGVVTGFWKLSWQRTTSRSTEKELLDLLHNNGWVPGLVRHYPETSVRDPDATAVFHPSGQESIGRVRDILHLGSIGQPLSECETVGEMLDTMYDLIEVHAHVCDLGVLHRDVSYFNVMCNPQHHIAAHPVLGENGVLERPCIRKIFGDEKGQPCVLLTDLDHATTFDELATGALDIQKTVGTPMFTSVFLAAPLARRQFMFKRLALLFQSLDTAEKSDPALFRRAFPNGDGDFMAKFRRVMAAEDLRPDPPKATPIPQVRHDWRHDAESIFWVYLYAFARARPLGTDPAETSKFCGFCRDMLMDIINQTSGEPLREGWLGTNKCNELFAPPLESLETLFNLMAMYLTIPWHIYCAEGGIMAGNKDHVHVAFRRLILGFKLDSANADTLAVRLDTSSPRVTTAFDNEARQYATPTGRREATGASQLVSSTTRAMLAEKRKAETQAAAVTDSATRDTKRTKTSTASVAAGDAMPDIPSDNFPSQPDEGQELFGPDHTDDAGDIAQVDEPEVKAEPVEQYDATVHRRALSARALRLMFWKDRSLWFGRGK